MLRPPRENLSDSMIVKGHGPAMHEMRTFRNCLCSPASNGNVVILAFHLPSGEHGGREPQGTFTSLMTSMVRTADPIVSVLTIRVA